MSTHRHFDKICCVVLALTLLLTAVLMYVGPLGVQEASAVMGYENTLFDTSRVHTIDIVMEDWETFTANCKSEEYYACTVVIDGESYRNVAMRGKGNTSLSQVTNDRYSYKIEFDHYDSANTYYGLDKLCLNNLIQDNTYMKDYLVYRMMDEMGVAAPLCSYAYLTVNGEDWGLYLAVEGVEESFLQRNYGSDYGELYKPDSMSMGGGRGNGVKFDMDGFLNGDASTGASAGSSQSDSQTQIGQTAPAQMPGGSGDGSTSAQDGESTQPPEGNPAQGIDGMGGGQSGSGTQGDTAGAIAGQMPEGMTLPDGEGDGFDGRLPDGLTPPDGAALPDGRETPGGRQGDAAGMGGGQSGSDDVLLKYIDDDADSYANIFENAKTDVTEADQARLIQALKNLSAGEALESTVETDAVIRYFVVHNFVLNFDSYTGSMIHNYYLYEDGGQMQMIPWDYNLAFGGFLSADDATGLVNYPIDSPVSGGSVEDRPMIAWIFDEEEYTRRYHQYFAELIETFFDSGAFSEMIDGVRAMISPYVEKDPTKFCTYEAFEKGITTLKEFCLLRAESVSGQLDGTIGSTSDTQDSDTLIDAGEVQIDDMGSMNGTMGGGMAPAAGGMQKGLRETSAAAGGAESDASDEDATPQRPGGDGRDGQLPDGTPPDLAGGDTGEQGGLDGGTPETDGKQSPDSQRPTQPQEQSTRSAAPWIAMGSSAAVLAAGLAFASAYKRRK